MYNLNEALAIPNSELALIKASLPVLPSNKNHAVGVESCWFVLAEEKGFEPLIPFRIYTLSRRAGSTTPALLRVRAAKIQSFGK
jgi:hypothetical protein